MLDDEETNPPVPWSTGSKPFTLGLQPSYDKILYINLRLYRIPGVFNVVSMVLTGQWEGEQREVLLQSVFGVQ